MYTMTTVSELERWFSEERLVPYRAASDGASGNAVDLYGWNAVLSAALWRTLGHVEILLRQAMHRELLAWSHRRCGDERWYITFGDDLTARARSDVCQARRRVTTLRKPETPGRVVAELNLGFWRYLLASHYERTLWLSCLRRAFPHLRGLRKHLERPVADLHRLRNRLAHHEPIHHLPIEELREKALLVAGWIDPAARDWIHAGDTVHQVVNRRPRAAPGS